MFRKFASRLAAALSLATPKEIDGISAGLNAAIRGTKHDTIISDETQPTDNLLQRVPRYRLRDRNTKFSRRAPALTPRELHTQVNNKGLQFINNPLLHGLLYKSGAMDAAPYDSPFDTAHRFDTKAALQ